jgi:hypothetical protein
MMANTFRSDIILVDPFTYLNASEQSRKCGNNSYSNVVANRSHMEPAIRIFFLWLWCSNDNQKMQVWAAAQQSPFQDDFL